MLRRLSSIQTLVTSVFLIIGLLGLLFGYLQLQDPEPAVTLEIVSETNVLDLRRPLQDLNIVFRNENIQAQGLNLRIFTINVANTGQVDILQGHYDYEDDWGLKFNSGEVIEARIVDTNSEYLKSKVVPTLLGVGTVGFPKVIFEKGDYFALEVLLLHPKDEAPAISPIGKIAGVKKIIVSTRPSESQEDSFVSRVFEGSGLIQVVRLTVYFMGSMLALVVAILGGVLTTETINRLKAWTRRRRISQSSTIRRIEQREIRDFLVSRYELNGTTGLRQLQELVKNPQRMEEEIPRYWDGPDDLQQIANQDAEIESFIVRHSLIDSRFLPLALMRSGLATKGQDGKVVIDPKLGQEVDNLLRELEN